MNTNITNAKGSAIVWVIILVLAIVVAVILVTGADEAEAPTNEQVGETVQEEQGAHDDSPAAIIERAPSITLSAVGDFNAAGRAWLAIHDGQTFHRIEARNMPPLEGDMFYEGWLVIPGPADPVSTGEMAYDPATQTAALEFISGQDLSTHRFVTITLEPRDGDPAPAETHVIEGTFSADADLDVE